MDQPLLWLRPWLWFAAVLVLGLLLWLLAPVLTPFAIAALLAWLADPLVVRLERSGRSRTVAASLIFLLMSAVVVLALLLLLPMLQSQLRRAVDWLPQLAAWATGVALPWLQARTGLAWADGVDAAGLTELLKGHWQAAGGIAAQIITGLSRSGLAVVGFVINLLLVPFVTFYFMRDWRYMLDRLHRLLPRPLEPTVVRLARESDAVLGAFLRGQMTVMICLGLIYGIGLGLVGLDLGFLIGMVAGLLSFVPYLGTTVGLVVAIVATLVEHGDLFHLVLVVAVFSTGQVIESYFLTPWLVGDRIGLHPVAVVFAVMAGGTLFGFLGVLLALPVAAVVMVLGRYAHGRYLQSLLYRVDRDGDGQPDDGIVGAATSAGGDQPPPATAGDSRPA